MGVSIGLANAPEVRRNASRAAIPSTVPSISESAIPGDTSRRGWRQRSNRGQWARTCSRDSMVELSHGQVWGSSKENQNTHVLCEPGQSFRRVLASWPGSAHVWLVGLLAVSDRRRRTILLSGGSSTHSLTVASLDLRRALDRVVPMGDVLARSVARLARRSARSFRGIPQ